MFSPYIQYYVSDNWYGQYYQKVVSNEDGKQFKTKKDCSEAYKELKKWVRLTNKLNALNLKLNKLLCNFYVIASDNLKIADITKVETYKYCPNGPSFSANRSVISLSLLIKENKQLEEKIESANEQIRLKKYNERMDRKEAKKLT